MQVNIVFFIKEFHGRKEYHVYREDNKVFLRKGSKDKKYSIGIRNMIKKNIQKNIYKEKKEWHKQKKNNENQASMIYKPNK